MTIYDYTAKTITGEEKSLSNYRGQVVLIVNTASECGFTKQYKDLEELYQQFKNEDFTILGFPCNQFGNQEPGNETDIKAFCEKNYGVTFPLFSKVAVKGDDAHPLFSYLTTEAKGLVTSSIKWNFTKFLINKQGQVVDRFAPQKNPKTLTKQIEDLLKE